MKFLYILNFFAGFFVSFFEVIGIGSIAVFVGAVIEPEIFFLGYENIKTKFGIVNCYKFRPYIESGRVFRDSESLTLWVSNDKNKIPIKIEAELRIGSIEADLEGFKGLKFPFKIIINE